MDKKAAWVYFSGAVSCLLNTLITVPKGEAQSLTSLRNTRFPFESCSQSLRKFWSRCNTIQKCLALIVDVSCFALFVCLLVCFFVCFPPLYLFFIKRICFCFCCCCVFFVVVVVFWSRKRALGLARQREWGEGSVREEREEIKTESLYREREKEADVVREERKGQI